MATSPTPSDRRDLRRRGLAAVVTLVVGIVLVACTAPASETTTASTAASSTTTTDPGSGPTSITANLRTVEVASGFDDPTMMVNRPMRNQLWVAERAGRIRVVTIETDWNLETGQTQRGGYRPFPGTVLDISSDVATDGEKGLLGIAFSTDARTLFLNYVNRSGEIIVASWNVNDPTPPPPTTVAPPPVDPAAPSTTTTTRANASTTSSTALRSPLLPPEVDGRSKRVMLSIPHGGTSNFGGQIALGRDGFLYVGVGDATMGAAERSAQDTESLLGKILRIDPGGATFVEAYAIPPSNPFARGGGAAPVFTIGIQNPLRFSFDRSNGDLWLGDAGAGRTQEIVLLTAASGGGSGVNLGWPLVEGTRAADGDAPSDLVPPLVAFESGADGCPVIGGYVYRGAAITELRGVYVYGDRCSGAVSGVLQRRGRVLDRKPLGPQLAADRLSSFAEDDQGELYVVLTNGSIQRLVGS